MQRYKSDIHYHTDLIYLASPIILFQRYTVHERGGLFQVNLEYYYGVAERGCYYCAIFRYFLLFSAIFCYFLLFSAIFCYFLLFSAILGIWIFLVWLKGGAILCYFLLFWGRQPHQTMLKGIVKET